MTSDREQLHRYIEAWKTSVDDVVALLRDLPDEAWAEPTDLPGWDVRAIACHLAHIESTLVGAAQPPVDGDRAALGNTVSKAFTEAGVLARKSHTHNDVLDELTHAAEKRLAELRESPPSDGKAPAPTTPGGLAWTWETLLSNRVVDVWMHGQDIRRAVGRPGGLDDAGAAHTASVFLRSFGYSVGKRVAPPTGTTVLLDVSGGRPIHLALEVNDQGRAVPATDPAEPTAALRMDLESFVILAGGRRPAGQVDVQVTGDQELAQKILEAMAVTP